MSNVVTLQSLAPRGRKTRSPKHKFQIDARPFQIVPFMIAPVLPAETLTSHYIEAREVTDPVKNALLGWTSEYYVFYVRIRDLDARDTLDDLFIEPTQNLSGLAEAKSSAWYHSGSGVNYMRLALKRITETYFRDEGEAWNNADIGSYPSAQIRDQAWMDSLTDTTTLSAGVGDPGAATSPEQLDKLMDAYEYLRSMSLMDMEFDDYLRTFGISVPKEQSNKPQLLDQWRDFQYPSNTVEPTTGVPSSACSWVHKRIGRKKWLFKEPGFVIGVHVVRPKVYFSRQFGSMTHLLDQGLSWLPAIMKDSPETSLREFTGGAAGNGPLSDGTTGPTNGYWVDMRDLFLYGDQFTNVNLADTNRGFVALPTAALGFKYPTSAMVDAFFAGAANTIRSDGFANLSILGMQTDFTPTTSVELR